MVFNKADRIEDKALLQNLCRRFDAVAISALDKSTLTDLLQKIESFLADRSIERVVHNKRERTKVKG